MKHIFLITSVVLLAVITLSAQQTDSLPITGQYLGQQPPGEIPEVFAKDVFSGALEYGGFVFSKSGDEVFFFSRDNKGHYSLNYSGLSNGCWLKPRRVFQANSANDVHPFFSNDCKKILFGSDRRVIPNEKVPYHNLWVSEKLNGAWTEAKPLSGMINTGWENCGSFSTDGRLFFRRSSQQTRGDIFQAEYANGEFSKPAQLPKEVNTQYDESHPAIAPDESYIIFSSKRPGGFNKGMDDLWICFRKDEKWTKAINMGNVINDGSNTSCATISPDGKYIFFVRIANGVGIPYWVSAKIIEELRPKD